MEEVVIIGAGVAGLAASLGLHRLGIRSLVLESADSLRVTGSAFGLWNNAWKAVDVLSIGDSLRCKYTKLHSLETFSIKTGLRTSEQVFEPQDSRNDYEVRCVNRRVLLETMLNELPQNSVRYSSKVVNIETDGELKSLHLADGTSIRTKVVVGADGVNSVVAKFLGLTKPRFVGRSEIRGMVWFEDGHGFEPKFMKFIGDEGIYYGIFPCDDYSVYWFFNFIPSAQDEEELRHDASKMKQYITRRLGKVPQKIRDTFEKTDKDLISYASLRYRPSWELLRPSLFKDNICVIGDALHPMTPDIGQGACLSLEDGVVVARVLGEAMKVEDHGGRRIGAGLEKLAREKRWRWFGLVSLAYLVGWMEASDEMLIKFLKKFTRWLVGTAIYRITMYDCGKLAGSGLISGSGM